MAKPVPLPPPGFDDLSVDEKIDYLQSLWDRIAATPETIPVPDCHREIIGERLKDLDANPNAGDTWRSSRSDSERSSTVTEPRWRSGSLFGHSPWRSLSYRLRNRIDVRFEDSPPASSRTSTEHSRGSRNVPFSSPQLRAELDGRYCTPSLRRVLSGDGSPFTWQ
jgi:putative addiction module component (TIGR02574 family)